MHPTGSARRPGPPEAETGRRNSGPERSTAWRPLRARHAVTSIDRIGASGAVGRRYSCPTPPPGVGRPGTAGGITFVTLEDETDVANLVVYKDFMEANRKVLLGSRYVVAEGMVERQGDVIHLKVEGVRTLDDVLPDTKQKQRRFH